MAKFIKLSLLQRFKLNDYLPVSWAASRNSGTNYYNTEQDGGTMKRPE